MKLRLFFLLFVLIAFFSACSSTKLLTENQYMLTKNSVEMTDVKGDFTSLNNYLLPLPNIKFMGVFNMKTSLYAVTQPKVKKNSDKMKDSKLRRWLREQVAEPPVLLDSSKIETSVLQLKMAMKKIGYFNASINPEVVFDKKGRKKAQVVYYVTANEPYYVRDVKYDIDVQEYKKIVVLNKNNSLLKNGMKYDEEAITAEFERIINLLRDEGYYYVNSSMIYCEVDTMNANVLLDKNHHKTIALTLAVKIPENVENRDRFLYKYHFGNSFVYSNYDINATQGNETDSVAFLSLKDKNDRTLYTFITPKSKKKRFTKKGKVVMDYKYKTITDAIYSKKGIPFSQQIYSRSKKSLNDLKNFSFIDIVFMEDTSKIDTIMKTGELISQYRLTRKKLHGFGAQLDARTDKASLSLTYSNKNIFKGAEYLNFNVYGSYFYYSKKNPYPEVGATVSLDIPRLFLLKYAQKSDALRYSTSIKVGTNYSGLYRRWLYNVSYAYNWNPDIYVNHVVTPIDISTINTDERRSMLDIDLYRDSYQKKFGKFFLLSFKYNFNYVVPIKKNDQKHNMRLSLFYESSGLFLSSLNYLAHPEGKWTVNKYNYSSFQNAEFIFRYNYSINANNSIATRFDVGASIPVGNGSIIPYDRGFYVGGSNSMRAWAFRSLGPGSYTGNKSLEYVGDVKIEVNLEYRGTIYKAFKYGIFADFGNIWLSQKQDDMPNADFAWNRFYKEIAMGVGAGIRLDFNFFIIRLDYAVPVYDPTILDDYGKWINSKWIHNPDNNKQWRWTRGFKFAIGHAF